MSTKAVFVQKVVWVWSDNVTTARVLTGNSYMSLTQTEDLHQMHRLLRLHTQLLKNAEYVRDRKYCEIAGDLHGHVQTLTAAILVWFALTRSKYTFHFLFDTVSSSYKYHVVTSRRMEYIPCVTSCTRRLTDAFDS